MAIKLNELEVTGTRWQAPTQDYPQGSFINGTGQGKRDGSYAKAEWANDIFGFHGAILKNGDETPNGQVETAENSQVFNALKKIIKNDIDTLGGDPSAVASGDVNNITATFTKPVSFEGGKLVKVRAIGANTSETVTFNPNGLGAKQIVKGDNDNLSIGDIAGEGFWITLIYDATLDKWVLQNPATGVTLVLPEASTSAKGIIQIATSAEVSNGADKTKAVTPYDLMQNFVSVVAQSLTTEQKSQVVQNLVGTFLPLSGGTMTGAINLGTGIVTKISSDSLKELVLKATDGGLLALRTVDTTGAPGSFVLQAINGDTYNSLEGLSTGHLYWNGKEVERVNEIGENYIRYESGLQIVFGTVDFSFPTSNKDYFWSFSYPVPFSSDPVVSPSWNGDQSGNVTINMEFTENLTLNIDGNIKSVYSGASGKIHILAIGRWK